MKFAALIIGDEILSGRRSDKHLAKLMHGYTAVPVYKNGAGQTSCRSHAAFYLRSVKTNREVIFFLPHVSACFCGLCVYGNRNNLQIGIFRLLFEFF